MEVVIPFLSFTLFAYLLRQATQHSKEIDCSTAHTNTCISSQSGICIFPSSLLGSLLLFFLRLFVVLLLLFLLLFLIFLSLFVIHFLAVLFMSASQAHKLR